MRQLPPAHACALSPSAAARREPHAASQGQHALRAAPKGSALRPEPLAPLCRNPAQSPAAVELLLLTHDQQTANHPAPGQ